VTTTAPPPGRLARTARPALRRVSRRLEALPLRLRLIAILVVLLLVALTLTAGATAVLMRKDLVAAVDRDLQRAWPTVARQALDTLRTQSRSRLPTGYAVVFYPTCAPTVPSRSPRASGTPCGGPWAAA
jgi:two-component system, OmpR family, sensor kinase